MNADSRGIFVITGIMASGKSTVAQLLAERFHKGVHVRGDIFRRMVVSGREEMSPHPSEEAMRQLYLRYTLAASTADAYYEAGFTVVVQDNIIGKTLEFFLTQLRSRPVYVVSLCPRPDVVAAREAARPKKGYGDWHVADFDRLFRDETPRIGLWLDSSDMTPDDTVDAILANVETAARI